MLEQLTKHFLVLSAAAAGLSAFLVMIFLTSYLGIFDLSLVWIIEYQDVAKLALLSIALVSGYAAFSLGWASDFIAYVNQPSKTWLWILISGLFLQVLGATVTIYFDIRSNSPLYYYHILRPVSQSLVVYLIALPFFRVQHWKAKNWYAISNDVSTYIVAVGVFGSTLGVYVRDVKGYDHVITTKSNVFRKASIVLLTSHHSVFLVGGYPVIVPTPDVTSISTLHNDEEVRESNRR